MSAPTLAGALTWTPDEIVEEVARRLGLEEGVIWRRSRVGRIPEVRQVAFWVLQRTGVNPNQIARLFGLNHSTVVHGVERAEGRTDLLAIVAPVVGLAGAAGPRQALRRWLERGLPRLSSEDLAAVEAYCACTLLGWERRPGTVCAYGLLLVMARPGVRGAVEEALRRCDEASAIGRIDLQAAQAGYRTQVRP